MADTDLERRLRELRQLDESRLAADTARAWRQITLLRRHDAARRRRSRIIGSGALAAAAAAAILAGPVLAGSHPNRGSGHARSSTSGSRTRVYPDAVVARIPVAAGVVVQAGPYAWTLTQTSVSGHQQLVRIDLRTNQVTLRNNLGLDPQAMVAAGGGAVWVTTRYGQAGGQVVQLDPATGRPVRTLHLPAGPCLFLAYNSSGLWARCTIPRGATTFLLINPATGRSEWTAGPRPRYVGPTAVTPGGVWYVASASIKGLVRDGSGVRRLTVRDPSYPVSLGLTDSLVYAAGYLWALTTDESIAKISPETGQVVRVYTYLTYDPRFAEGLNFLAVGHGSLWFLDDGSLNVSAKPFFGVLRASMASGRLLGAVPAGSQPACGEPCFEIYSTPSAIWVPTSRQLIRIDPGLVPVSSSVTIFRHRS
jgi:hypothetical protein